MKAGLKLGILHVRMARYFIEFPYDSLADMLNFETGGRTWRASWARIMLAPLLFASVVEVQL